MGVIRLFNEPAGQDYLKEQGVPVETIEQLPLMGISSVANMLQAIKLAKYYELTDHDIILTVFTDSMELYQSRLAELETECGSYQKLDAAIDYHKNIQAVTTDHMLELTYYEKKRIVRKQQYPQLSFEDHRGLFQRWLWMDNPRLHAG